MMEDELLKLQFKYGSRKALQRIYEKYLNYLLTLAMAFLNDAASAEDVVHDVFVGFAKSAEDFKLTGNLRSYLTTCVVNRARDKVRANHRNSAKLDDEGSDIKDCQEPVHTIISDEESRMLNKVIAQLPQQQREVIILHLKGEMKFREIAKLQNVSINTVQGRYRYGLNKLRSILDGEMKK